MSAIAQLPQVVSTRYAPKTGSRITDKDAALLGEAMERLRAEDNLTPSTLIAAARPKRSPIHHLWTWDVQAAAEAHWLTQARYYMRSVVKRVEYDTGDVEEVRAFHVIREEIDEEDGEPKEDHWYSVQDISEDAAYSSQVIARAKAELAAFDRKYRQYRRVFAYERTLGRAHDAIVQVLRDEDKE